MPHSELPAKQWDLTIRRSGSVSVLPVPANVICPSLAASPGQHLRSLLSGAIAAMALFSFDSAFAETNPLSEPFAVKHQNPFILIYGLPAASAARLLPSGASSWQLQFDASNHSKTSSSSTEEIVLDGETYRTTLSYRRGFENGIQLGVELPLVSHRPGVMDNFIEDWHDIFGLSNRDRTSWPKNRLLFSYTRDGSVEAQLESGSTGVGDLQLLFSKQLRDGDAGRYLAFNASLKLPTGDPDRFQGSGAADLAFWLSGASPALFEHGRVGGYLQAGLLMLGEGDLLTDQQRDRVWFGTLGLHWQPYSWLVLKGQLDAASSFYDSDLDQLGGSTVIFTLGGTIPLDREGRDAIDLAIGENLATDTVADFTINLAYRHRFE